jgi:hypothetical protein
MFVPNVERRLGLGPTMSPVAWWVAWLLATRIYHRLPGCKQPGYAVYDSCDDVEEELLGFSGN